MTIIEKLKRYRELKSELEDLEQNIPVVQDSVQGSQAEFPNVLQNHHISGVEPVNYSLLERKSDLKAQIKEIEVFVNSIPFYKVRKAVKLYYIEPIESGEDKPTWEKVADSIPGETAGSIKMKVSRFIKTVTNVTHVTN